ncbi:MAG TPA: polysaccharide ABC transporter ATP-binding protein [Lacunisphaera sp.]|jgi:lipopolysaccharide transport system ATP-binding protein|nr:ATP-binding cassette domain-containing protein [Lacunisphaera sp.]HQY04656.1 polysaccharide ABC transporter ATP-binding protein [Lacunisphaera sp.]
MPQPVISVSGLGKRYYLTHEKRTDTLRDSLTQTIRRLVGGNGSETDAEEFWALRDVSFDVNQGDVVGIIGRNGAGKSTLLKILSRITEPTTGTVRLRGRVASLLEVGTGFHPELSGRENIYLNGAILGMSRAEITRKFDEIVAFAEVERFLDTQVKHYSSGMYVRLAFAVAAHLEPEILIVDEVLAVGDAAFQRKCLGKMQAVSRSEGRTVLFVSHNLPSVRELCRSAVLLAGGQVQATGPCSRVLEIYQHGLANSAPTSVPTPPPDLLDRGYATGLVIENLAGLPCSDFPVGTPWRARVRFRIVRGQPHFVVALGLKSADGIAVQTAWHPPCDLAPGDYEVSFTQENVIFEAGTYSVLIGLSESDRGLQQFEGARLDLTSERAVGYYPGTAGLGLVLNSMATSLQRL